MREKSGEVTHTFLSEEEGGDDDGVEGAGRLSSLISLHPSWRVVISRLPLGYAGRGRKHETAEIHFLIGSAAAVAWPLQLGAQQPRAKLRMIKPCGCLAAHRSGELATPHASASRLPANSPAG